MLEVNERMNRKYHPDTLAATVSEPCGYVRDDSLQGSARDPLPLDIPYRPAWDPEQETATPGFDHRPSCGSPATEPHRCRKPPSQTRTRGS